MSRGARARGFAALTVAAVLVSTPTVAAACAVCSGSDTEGARLAFILTTGFMTATPLLLVGATLYGLWRRFQRLEREAEAERRTGERAIPISLRS